MQVVWDFVRVNLSVILKVYRVMDGCNLEGGGGGIKIWGGRGGKGCMCIKGWLKPVFPLFLT